MSETPRVRAGAFLGASQLGRFLVVIRAWAAARPLLLILLLGLALRLVGSEARSLSYDDTFSIFLARRSFAEILSGTAADTMPPLYYFVLHLWMQAGEVLLGGAPVWYIRLLTVVLNLAAVAAFYGFIQHLFGRRAALWSALLAVIAPLQIYHAQDVRMYALLLCGQVGYLYCFARLFLSAPGEVPRRLNWAGLVVGGLVAMYSHNVAVFGLVIPDVFLILRRDWRGLLRLAAAQLVIGLLALPWLLLLPGQIAKVQRAWSLPQPGLVEVLQAIIAFAASLPLPFALLAAAAVLSVQLLALITIETWRFRRGGPGLLLLLCALLVPPALLFAASYVMRPVFVPRAFLISALAYCGLAGVLAARSELRGVGGLILGGFLLAALISLPSFYTYREFPRSPYREAAGWLRENAREARIIHENKLSAFPARFYAPELDQVFIADVPNSPNDTFEPASQAAMQIFPEPDLAAAAGEREEVYYVLFRGVFAEYRAVGLTEHPGLQWLDAHYRRVGRQVFEDLEIYHYRR